MSFQYTDPNTGFPVKVTYYTKNNLVGEQVFDENATFGNILDFFAENLQNENHALFDKYYINGKKLRNSDKISNNFQVSPKSKPQEILLALEINDNAQNEKTHQDSEIYEKILKPNCNPFSITTYIPKYNVFSTEILPQEVIECFGLNYFTNNCAYCNSNDELFLSGSEKFNLPFNDFWIIKHKNLNIDRKRMPVVKRYHSMIYLQGGIIFIVGGDNLKTLYYDISEDKFFKWTDLNEKHIEPALFFDGEYLYVFNMLTKNVNFFERTKVDFENVSEWEKIYPQFEGVDPIEFFENSFAVCNLSNGNVLFVGGTQYNPNTFIYNLEENIISVTGGNNENIPLKEKNFYKFNDNLSVALPADFEQNQTVVIIDNNGNDLKTVTAQKSNSNKTKNNLNSSKGEVSLKGKFMPNSPKNADSVVVRTLGKPVFNLIDGFKSTKTQSKNLRSVPQKNTGKNKALYAEEFVTENKGKITDEEYILDENGNLVGYEQVNYYDPTYGNAYNENYVGNYPEHLKICTNCGELYEEENNENIKLRKIPEIDEEVIKSGGKTQLIVKNFEKNLDDPCDDLLDYAAEENDEEDENKNEHIVASENKILEENILKLPNGL